MQIELVILCHLITPVICQNCVCVCTYNSVEKATLLYKNVFGARVSKPVVSVCTVSLSLSVCVCVCVLCVRALSVNL